MKVSCITDNGKGWCECHGTCYTNTYYETYKEAIDIILNTGGVQIFY